MPWNTTAPSDLEKLRRYCKIPAQRDWLDLLRTAMARIERDSPETIATVQEILSQIEALRTQKAALVTSKDLGLIKKKVDVLEWEWGDRSQGDDLDTLEARYVDELASILMIDLPGGGGGAYLARS